MDSLATACDSTNYIKMTTGIYSHQVNNYRKLIVITIIILVDTHQLLLYGVWYMQTFSSTAINTIAAFMSQFYSTSFLPLFDHWQVTL
jgi:hypothetical protein